MTRLLRMHVEAMDQHRCGGGGVDVTSSKVRNTGLYCISEGSRRISLAASVCYFGSLLCVRHERIPASLDLAIAEFIDAFCFGDFRQAIRARVSWAVFQRLRVQGCQPRRRNVCCMYACEADKVRSKEQRHRNSRCAEYTMIVSSYRKCMTPHAMQCKHGGTDEERPPPQCRLVGRGVRDPDSFNTDKLFGGYRGRCGWSDHLVAAVLACERCLSA